MTSSAARAGTTERAARAGAAPSAVEPVDRARLTGRAAVLFVVVAMLAVAYAWPLREFVQQRSEIAGLRAGNAAAEARVQALEQQKARWRDPAYVEAQARDRLHMVLPGETAYVTLRPGSSAPPQTLPPPTPRAKVAWYDALWATVRAADEPPTS